MNRRPPFYQRKPVRDPLAGLTDEMRDALEADSRAMLVFWEDGDVRAVTHPASPVCKSVTMRVLLGLALFEPIDDGLCIRLTRKGEQLARLLAGRRARFAAMRAREAASRAEGRAFIDRMNERTAQERACAEEFERRRAEEKGSLQ